MNLVVVFNTVEMMNALGIVTNKTSNKYIKPSLRGESAVSTAMAKDHE